MDEKPIMIDLPSIDDVARDLLAAANLLAVAHGLDRCEVCGGTGGEAWCDVRLNVQRLGWDVKWGPSDYDQDHRGFWGAASVSSDSTLSDCEEIARDLLDQVSESIAMTDGFAVEGELEEKYGDA